jgi:hypothetical protein
MTAKKIQPEWPVNELGEILGVGGVGTETVVRRLPSNLIPTDPVTHKVPFVLPPKTRSYTVATLPAPATSAGVLALASDAAGGPTVVYCDGTYWKIVAVLGATVS